MPALVNGFLGTVFLLLGLGIFYGQYHCEKFASALRERLRGVFGEGLEVHDWIFAGLFLLVGALALSSAVMWVGRSHYFWMVTL